MRVIGGELVVATGNAGKVAEFARLLDDWPVRLRLQSDLGVIAPPETGLTFVENALLKARAAAAQTGLPALADDSGLAVDALGGAPGIRSARYAEDAGTVGAGEDRDAANRRELLRAMAALDDGQREACFVCALVLLRHADDPTPIIAEGRWPGAILREERGDGGFGYDPVFFVTSHGRSAAELDPVEKNAISHRGIACRALLGRLAAP
jgi:XTP/dITP diphosphohydrolase